MTYGTPNQFVAPSFSTAKAITTGSDAIPVLAISARWSSNDELKGWHESQASRHHALPQNAQVSAEHRRTPTRSPEDPMNASMSAQRQSGLQSSAQSQHHLGASLSLSPRHSIDIIPTCPNSLKLVSTFRGEDQSGHGHVLG